MGRYNILDRSHRVRVRGSVTLYEPGSQLVIENAVVDAILVHTRQNAPLNVGDEVDATGFADANDYAQSLADGQVPRCQEMSFVLLETGCSARRRLGQSMPSTLSPCRAADPAGSRLQAGHAPSSILAGAMLLRCLAFSKMVRSAAAVLPRRKLHPRLGRVLRREWRTMELSTRI